MQTALADFIRDTPEGHEADAILREVERMSSAALRVLAIAQRELRALQPLARRVRLGAPAHAGRPSQRGRPSLRLPLVPVYFSHHHCAVGRRLTGDDASVGSH